MNVSLQDVRHLGYKKIYNYFCGDERLKMLFTTNLERVNTLFSGFKIQPYSFLGYYDSIKGLDDLDGNSIKRLVKNTEPLIDISEPDNASKRKFRNTWTLIWEKFGEVNNLSQIEVSILSDLGLKLPLVLSSYTLLDEKAIRITKDLRLEDTSCLTELSEFYNAVINWFCLTQFESLLTVKHKSLFDLLKFVALEDSEDFTNKLKSGVDIWD